MELAAWDVGVLEGGLKVAEIWRALLLYGSSVAEAVSICAAVESGLFA